MNLPQPLPPPAFARAAAFMHQARPLERALFRFHFETGSAAQVQSELQAYQNSDGGFHSLEPDVGLTASSTLCTCHGLHLLHEVETPVGHPLVQRALDWLLANFDANREVWTIIPPHDNSEPHAPWWHCTDTLLENWGGFLDNPRPDVLACLQHFACTKTDALRQQVTESLLKRLRSGMAKMEMHGLMCYLRLYLAPGLADELRRELAEVIPNWIKQNLEQDVAKWTGYGLRPLDVAPTADSPWRRHWAADVEHHLDFLIANQNPDGSWHPYWNWGDSFPAAWPAARLRWQAIITLNALRNLKSYGRIAS